MLSDILSFLTPSTLSNRTSIPSNTPLVPLSLVGNTPTILLPKLSKFISINVFVKCEYRNPGGSSKDRIAKRILEDALERNEISEGDTVYEGFFG